MSLDDPNERLVNALSTLPQTKAEREKIPPGFLIATGHDDEVMLFLVHVGDSSATADVLLGIITLAESRTVVDWLAETGGLIHKRLNIEIAQRLKRTLANAGTEVQLVRPFDA